MSVEVLARQAAVQSTGMHAAMVVGDRGDDDSGHFADDPAWCQAGNDLVEGDLRIESHRRGSPHGLSGAEEPEDRPGSPVGAMSKWRKA